MQRIQSISIVVWSSASIDKEMPLGRECGRCKKLHEDHKKNCQACKEYRRVYIKANKVTIAEKKAAYCEANKVAIAAYNAEYREANKVAAAAYTAVYREEKKEEIAAQRAGYREAHREDMRATQNAYNHTREGKMKSIKRNAKAGQKIITMTDDEIMIMADAECMYCGTETIDAVKRNGIDRLDSSVGYIIDNCVPCCGMCNYMKGQVDPLTFVERCAHISYLNGGKGRFTKHWYLVKKQTYNVYKNRMTKKGVAFELTNEEFEDLRARNCMYCHRPSTSDHSNGIDRVDPKGGYILSNCVTCCHDCNMMKASRPVGDFLKQCIKIAGKDHVFPDVPRVLSTFTKKYVDSL